MKKSINMQQEKKVLYGYFSFLLTVSIICSFLFLIAPQISKAAADTAIFFSPASESVFVGEQFILDATINPGANHVSAVEIHVTFDPTKFQLNSVTPSATFSDLMPTIAGQTPLHTAAVIDNAVGTGFIIPSVPTSNLSATINPTVVASFNFEAIATVTNSPIAFDATTVAAADGETANVITTKTGAAVTVVIDSGETVPPVISQGAPLGTLAVGTTQTTVSVATNENATCKYATASGISYASMTAFTSTGARAHSFVAVGLVNAGSYGFYVRCQDANNNSNQSDYLVAFSIAAPAVIVPPVVASTIATPAAIEEKKSSSKDKKKVSSRTISNSKKSLKRGATLTQRGKKFSKNSIVLMYFSKPGGGYYPPAKIKTSGSGSFMVKYIANKPKGTYSWYAVDTKNGKKSKIKYYKIK